MCDSAASSISSLTQATPMSKVQTSVARKALDVEQAEGDAAVKLIQSVASIGERLNQANASAKSDAGSSALDVYA